MNKLSKFLIPAVLISNLEGCATPPPNPDRFETTKPECVQKALFRARKDSQDWFLCKKLDHWVSVELPSGTTEGGVEVNLPNSGTYENWVEGQNRTELEPSMETNTGKVSPTSKSVGAMLNYNLKYNGSKVKITMPFDSINNQKSRIGIGFKKI